MTKGYVTEGVFDEWEETPDAPAPLLAFANATKHQRIAASEGVEENDPANRIRAEKLIAGYIADGDVARERQGGDDRSYRLAAEVRGFDLSPEVTLEVMLPWNNECDPPWPIDELRAKIENAYRYAKNEAGAFAVPPLDQRFTTEALDRHKAESVASAPVAVSALSQQGGLLPSYMGREISTITPPQWLIKGVIPSPAVGILFGKFGSFKTTGGLDLEDAVLMGTAAFGHFQAEKKDVVSIHGEGLSGLKSRIEARARLHGVGLEQYPLLLVAKVPRVDRPEEWAALVATIEARGLNPGLILFDHLSIMLSGQDQNDATIATQAMQLAQALATHFNCTVLIIAHAGKDGEREVRGSSAFLDNVDFAYELTRSEDSNIVKVRCAKMRDGEAPEPFYLKAESRHGAAIMTYANADEARRASGKAVGLRAADVSAVLVAMGACPGGANEWTGSAGGIPTRVLATEIAAARHRGNEDGLEPSAREIDVLVMSLNRGAQGGPLDPYVVREKPRQWAVAPGPVSTGVHHA